MATPLTHWGSLWREYRRTRRADLRARVIEHHLGLVKQVAMRVAVRLPSHVQVDDLYSAGLLGFIGAVEDYDPGVGVDFPVYATPRIRGAIFDELRRLDVVPRGVRRRLREAEQAIGRLTGRLGRPPTDEEVAGELGLTLAAYDQLLGEGVRVVSLDALVSIRDESRSMGDALADERMPGALQVLAAKEQRARLGRLIDGLPTRERQVLALYYAEELTMRQVGEVLGVTESRVSQIHSSAILRLRAAL